MSATIVAGEAAPGKPARRATIRPGVSFPDWSAVRSATARRVVGEILDLVWDGHSWESYGDDEDAVRRAILTFYGESGKAPRVEALVARTGFSEARVRAALAGLRERDLIVVDGGGEVTGAYPLTDAPTAHTVRVGETPMQAMCAVDALGAGAMFGRDAVVASRCRACGGPIRVTLGDGGRTVTSHDPSEAVVWSGIEYAGSCAADSLCTIIAFFCSLEHLTTWRAAEHPETMGYTLSLDEALQVGMALFSPTLAPARRRRGSP